MHPQIRLEAAPARREAPGKIFHNTGSAAFPRGVMKAIHAAVGPTEADVVRIHEGNPELFAEGTDLLIVMPVPATRNRTGWENSRPQIKFGKKIYMRANSSRPRDPETLHLTIKAICSKYSSVLDYPIIKVIGNRRGHCR